MDEPTAYEELGHRNLNDAVFIKLKEQILNATLKPGQKLRQTELSKKYGVSRAPIRDALRKLEAEGLVTVNRGSAVVSSIDLDQFLEIYRIREVLESLAARMVVLNISDESLMALTELEKQMEQASRNGDLSLWLQLDHKFHNDSYRSCKSPILLKMIVGLWDSTYYVRRKYIALPRGTERAEQTHRAILEALARRDGKLYVRLVRKHIRETVHTVLKMPEHVYD